MRRIILFFFFMLFCFSAQSSEVEVCNKSIKILEKVEPRYPTDVMDIKEVEFVIMSFLVGLEGNVSDIEVTEFSNSKFRRTAVRTIKKWLFEYQPKVCRHEMRLEWVLGE